MRGQHDHEEYYTKADVDALLDEKADNHEHPYASIDHTHDPTPPDPTPPESTGPLRITGSNEVYENLLIENVVDAIVIEGASNITLRNITFRNVAGKSIYALDSSGIFVEDCMFEDGGRNFVQFDKVQGGHVLNCVGANQLGDSPAEDFISIYASHGTAEAPILVEGNILSNGGPSGSGSGIMLGDKAGTYQTARGNKLIDPGQVGIGVAGGQHITLDDNEVTSEQHAWSNVGIYVWNQSSSPCDDIAVTNNRVRWFNAAGDENPYWSAGNCQLAESGNDWHWQG